MVVLIPAALFLYFGMEISFEALTKALHYSEISPEMHTSPSALAVFYLFLLLNINFLAILNWY